MAVIFTGLIRKNAAAGPQPGRGGQMRPLASTGARSLCGWFRGVSLWLATVTMLLGLGGCGAHPGAVTLGALTADSGAVYQSGVDTTVLLQGSYQVVVSDYQVTVTVQPVVPPAGGGTGSFTVNAKGIDLLGSGNYRVHFTMPVLPITAAAQYRITAAGTSGLSSFTTSPALVVTVIPSPTLLTALPASGTQGQTLDVALTAVSTSFISGTTQASFGPDISVNGGATGAAGTVSVGSATTATAHIVIAATAALGARAITVTTGGQTVALPSGFAVTAAPLPPIASVGGPYAAATGTSIAFTAAGSSDPGGLALTYAWTFGDGGTAASAAPTHTYTAAGKYTVTVTVRNSAGLTSTASTTATVTDPPKPPVANAGGPYTGTTGSAVSFTGTGSTDPAGLALTYAWTFGDGGTGTGVTPTHVYAKAGTYTVGLTVTNSASLTSTASSSVVVTDPAQPPVANAGGPYTGVAGTAVAFSGAASTDPKGQTLTYSWSFGDSSTGTGVAPTHTYASAGTYTVTLTVKNTDNLTATSTATATITAAPQPPVANAGGPYTGVAGTAVAFNGAASTDPKGQTLIYSWSFGDSSTGTGVAPTHTYASAGTYTVTLTVKNTDNLTATSTATATITAAPQPPVANAGGPYTGVAGTAVAFSGAASTDPKGQTLTYSWSFGDSSTGTGVAPTHTYASAGTYTVTLTVKNTDNLTATSTATATITAAPQPPVANAGGPYSGVAGTAVAFSGAASTDPKNQTLTYAWNFGDTSTGTGIAPTHTYAAAGTYTVTLTVKNTDNLTSTSTATATISAAPQAPVANAGGPYAGVAGTAVSFSGAASSDPKNETLTYSWSFGDSSTGTGIAPTHTYAAAGTYTVTLTVKNTDNLTASATATATITAAPQPPVANAGGPYTGVAGTAVSFSGAASSDPKNETLTYSWNFGDSSTGTGVSPTHTYASAGTYTVTLTVKNTDNLTATAPATATITAAPQAPVANAGGPYAGVAGTAVSFSGAASSDPKNETLTYSWNFGDSSTGTGVAPTHTYAAAGTYTVTLTVKNTDNLSASATATATITAAPQPPVANAGGPYTGVAGTSVSFSGAASSDPKNETLTYSWNFGDSSVGTGANPTHTYAASGTYSVSLTVTNTDNFSATASTTATVAAPASQPPVAKAGGPYSGVAGTAVAFSGAASTDPKNEALTYAWMFGDGASGSGPTPSHTYSSAGTFTVSLTVKNTDGATATATTTATITAPTATPPTANAGGPYTGTAGTAINFSGFNSSDPNNLAGGGNVLTYAWGFGDGATATGPTPVHAYTAAGTFAVSLTVTSASGGTATASTTATIAAGTPDAGTPTAKPGGPYSAATNAAISFNGAASTDPNNLTLTYSWSFGDGATGTGASTTHTYTTGGSYSVVLTVSNGTTSNSASTTATITAPTSIAASAGGPYTVAANATLQLDGTASTNPNSRQLTFTWDFGDGSTGSGPTPRHVYTASGTYTVSVTVTDGLISGSATTTATVGAPAAESITANAGGPYAETVGRTVTFNATASTDSAGKSLTYAWTFGDGTSGTGVNPSHAYTAAGTYTATVTASSGTATGTATAPVAIANAINVTITSPLANALFGVNSVTVNGTVSTTGLTVNVNGVAATVSGTSFTATGVSLREGVNLLTATAFDGQGGVGSAAVSVVLDATAPTISITSPATGSSVSTPSITVAGLVNDITTGTIGSTDVTVKVNGTAAQVANRSFSLDGVVLVPGANIITAVTTDNVGHATTTTATVTYVPASSQLSLAVLSGNGQTGAVHSVLTQPLIVQLTAANGTPVAGRPVSFTVTRSDGNVEVMPNVSQTLYVTTDATGKASVLFQLGSRTGLGVNQVSVTTPGAAGSVTFTANSTAAAPNQIHIVRGANQRGLLGEPLAEGLQVIVQDAYSNPIPGVAVTYAVASGDGTLDHTTATTDANGKASANLTIGQQEGISNYVVTATFAGNTEVPVTFTASGYAPGPVANTSVSGMVLDNSNTPVQNATVRLLGTTLGTTTDANGRFIISGAPVGTVTLSVDGSTSTSTQTLPFLSFVLQDLPGQNNTLNKPIYLPKVDVDNAQTVGGDDPVTLTMSGVPGVAFTIAPHSVTFPDGSTVGKLSVSQVKSDMVPMEPTNGTGPDLIWTLQPAGTRFSVPVQVTLPNTQGLAPGTVSELYQYDHDLEQFVSSGTAHVSADGSVIVSDPGFGITKAGWGHGPTSPLPNNCTLSCKSTNECVTKSLLADCSCKETVLDGAACNLTPERKQCRERGTCVGRLCFGKIYKDGTACTGDLFCSNYDCEGGICTGVPIKDVGNTAPLGASQVQLSNTLDEVISPLKRQIAKWNLNKAVNILPELKLTQEDKLVCCEQTKLLSVPVNKTGFTLGLKLPFPAVPFPPPYGVKLPDGTVEGFYVTGSLTMNLGGFHRQDFCQNQDCYDGLLGVEFALEGGLNIDAKLVAVNANISGGIKAELKVECHALISNFSTLDLKATGSAKFVPTGAQISLDYIIIPSFDLGGPWITKF